MGIKTINNDFKTLRTRVSSLVAATVMTAGSLAAAAPLFLTQTALAAPNTTYTSRPFSSLALTPDRTAPSGSWSTSTDTLTMGVINSKATTTPGTTYSQTEGLQSSLASSSSVRAQLLVSNDWKTRPVRAGIWGIAGSTTNASELGWPIIEFTSNLPTSNYTGWRVWNTLTGEWTNVSFNTSTGWNQWYTLEVSYNASNKNFEFYINDSKVANYSATDGVDTFNEIHGVIFNQYNSASANPADDYSVLWQKFETGVATKSGQEQCKDGGYLLLKDDQNKTFKNQGLCVSYFNGRDNGPGTSQTKTLNLKF